MKILKNILVNNYIMENDDNGFIFQKELSISDKIKSLLNNTYNTLISVRYNEEITFKDFLDNYCYDKFGRRTNIAKNVFKISITNEISISKKRLKSIPKYLKEFENLESITINNCELENIDNLDNFNDLRHLNLSNNNIKNIKSIEKLINLKYLDLSNNKIEDITPIWDIENIKELYLSHNKIGNIPEKNKWWFLEKLDLSFNELRNIKNCFHSAKIETIILNNNKITNINKDTFKGSGISLKILHLYDNNLNLSKLEFIKYLINLNLLTLENNLLSEKNFEGSELHLLENIKKLGLSNNAFKELSLFDDNKFNNFCSKIEELSFSNNNLKDLKNLEKFSNLNSLFLNNNKIENLKDVFTSNLKNLDIFLNPLKYIDRKIKPEILSLLDKYNMNKDFPKFKYSDYEGRKKNIEKKLKDRKNEFMKKYKNNLIKEKIKIKQSEMNLNEENINFGF